ncbi:MAG: SLC13 family permease [Phycisphaeraceae bacterium]|nr:SLC13 family permease [Phycisphaeraceae bacterium]
MPWEAWFTLILIAGVIVALLRNMAGPDTVLLAALAGIMTLSLFSADGLLPTPVEAIAGFGNESLITIGVLFVVAAGLTQTGATSRLTGALLGRPKHLVSAQLRMMLPVAGLSAFLNNTPIVAMFMPVVSDWCRKTGMSPSKLFIPLSYAAILGGTCTLIGTSTNLVVRGLVADARAHGDPAVFQDVQLSMFTITAVGLPATVIGIVYILIASPRLLPERRAATSDEEEARRYSFEMLVEKGSAVDGRSIEQAGLRHLPGGFLVAIERDGERIVAVGPEQVLRGEDRLIFVGVVESVVDLQKIRGLVPATNQVYKLSDPRPHRCLVEAVVSDRCPLVGKSIRAGRFRTVYDAAVIAVHRGGARLANQKIGDIVLKPGDTLMIETHPRFVEQQRNRSDFYLVSAVEDSKPIRHDRAWIALTILTAMVLGVTFTPLTLLNGALLAGGLMVLTKCITASDARSNIDWRILLAIGAAIGVGRALGQSQAAEHLASVLLDIVAPLGNYGALAGIYISAMLFNMMIGNIASAVLIFPIAVEVARTQEARFMPFAVAIMMASSASYATPISYPTNLMVYGAGGYRYSDYLRIGLPLNFIIMAVTIALAPWIWPF